MNQREAFEKWADSKGLDLDREGDSYYETEAHFSWSAWQAAQQAQWQPIETAPDDFRVMFVVKGFKVRNGTYDTDPYCVWRDADGKFVRWPHAFEPTHWMQLPPEPNK